MNYVQTLKTEIAKELPGLPEDLLNLYTMLGLHCGVWVDNEEVHDAWSVWQNTVNPEHPALIPYDQLSAEKQELDTKYTEAIIRAVRLVAKTTTK
jgi:hypothetical protein